MKGQGMVPRQDIQEEIQKILAAIKAQEGLRGVLPDEQLEPALALLHEKHQALLAELGKTANGLVMEAAAEKQESNRVGRQVQTEGGAALFGKVKTGGGDLIGRDQYRTESGDVIVQIPRGADPVALREAYFNRVMSQTSHLSLAGIDPKAASEAESRLDLSAVYTALLTKATETKERPERVDSSKRAARHLSALEQLNRHSRLVLLGDPGSGKSTFLNFVALCLAGGVLREDPINLELLTSPLPAEDHEEDQSPRPQPWDHGTLLPVRVVLRDLAARGLPEPGQPAGAESLWRFLEADLEVVGLGGYAEHLRRELLERGGLLMLDGLDEVPVADRRREQIRQVVSDLAATLPRCRIIVTSRTYAYQKQEWKLPGFTDTELAPFTLIQIQTFVDRWYDHFGKLREMNAEDVRGKAELLKRAITANDQLQGLAERPLLLTLMASLHAWRGGTLPEKREELYANTVDLLLDWWESLRVVRDAKGKVVMIQPSMAEWLQVDRGKVRGLLNEIAFKAHAEQAELTDTADVSEKELVSGLMRLAQNPEVKPVRLVEYLSQRAGLLLPRGVGVYTFPHRTFQEYLAACHLTDFDYPDRVAELARDNPERWREVAMLAGAKAARGTASAIWSLVEALCYREPGIWDGSKKDVWGAHLAGQVLAEVVNLGMINERNQAKVSRVQAWLVKILEDALLLGLDRVRAGNTLAQLGDTRFEPHAWHLPAEPFLGFVEIPAGPFLMGSDPAVEPEASEKEQPQHELTLPSYFISRYPVTIAQFRGFVEDSGYKPGDEKSLRGYPNHPVNSVSWHDALAYCAWLEERLREWNSTPEPLASLLRTEEWKCILPSEAEWEKAARGSDGRLYPWGDTFDPELVNAEDSGIGATSPVGCFPGGASPYGILDLSGNLTEWTRSLYGDYPYPMVPVNAARETLGVPPESYHRVLKGVTFTRVLRGGSFSVSSNGVRCAVRNWDYPESTYYQFGFRVAVSQTNPGV